MTTIAEALTQAFAHHQAGRLAQAEPLYRAVLQADPRQVDALQLLGMVLDATGRSEQGAEYLRAALLCKPDFAEVHSNLAKILLRQGKREEARAGFQEAVRLKPDFAEAHYNLGAVLMELRQSEGAAAAYREAIRLKPASAAAYFNLGIALKQLGQINEAVASYREAVRLKPEHAEAHNNLAIALQALDPPEELAISRLEALRLKPDCAVRHDKMALSPQYLGQLNEAAGCYREAVRLKPDYAEAYCNLAAALQTLDQAEEAATACREAIRLKPDLAVAYFNLAIALQALGQYEEAAAASQEAIRLKPNHAEAYSNLANALYSLGRPRAAAACLREAIRRNSDHVETHFNLSVALLAVDQHEEAAAACREAIRLKPDHVDAHLNLSLAYLKLGNYVGGWIEYEWRWRHWNFVMRPLLTSRPLWDGTDLEKRSIFVYAEQGLGDTLQFIRYAPLVQARGGRVIVACQKPLVRFLQGCAGIDEVMIDHAEMPSFDVHAPLMSLPRIFGTTAATVPAAVPYLRADPKLVDLWRRELSGYGSFKVGINWKSNPHHPGHLVRSIPLRHFTPLARVKGVQFFSLQKHHGLEQLRDVAGILPIRDLSNELDVAAGPFMDTAAVMKSLDLVISADTAVTHLAGGLGVPIWVGLPFVSDWRWIVGREDSPWYPTMRLFQQREPDNWDEVFERMAGELEKVVR